MAIFDQEKNSGNNSGSLDAELLNSLPTLEMKAKLLADGMLAGVHKSRFSGSGSEFKEYTPYQPGDELRSVDWRLFARSDQLQIRRREDERNLNCTVLLDGSKSMNYPLDAADSKWNYAKLTAAAMNLFLQRQKDAFALGILGDNYIPFGTPSSRILEFKHNLDRLNNLNAVSTRPFSESLREGVERIGRSSIVMIISDFYIEIEELLPLLNKLFSERREVVLVRVLSPFERDLPFENPELFSDSEKDVKMIVRADLIREEYLKRMREHALSLADAVQSRGGDYLEIFTDQSPVKVLSSYINRRKSR